MKVGHKISRFFAMFITVLAVMFFLLPEETYAMRDGNATRANGYRPERDATDVQPSIKRAWERWNSSDRRMFIQGGKLPNHTQTSGRNLVYDVYKVKGWGVSGNFFTFEGWSAIIGHAHHYADNQATYIGAVNIKNEEERKIFKTEMIPVHTATKELGDKSDIYYERPGGTRWCNPNEKNRDQSVCNMEYKNVGFKAYIPLNELFPEGNRNKEWKFYLIKNIDGHLVYDQLILPFDNEWKDWDRGQVNLISGVNNKVGHRLIAIGANTQRRLKDKQRRPGVWFTQHRAYRISSLDETYSVPIWYGLITPEENNAVRWTISPYMRANGKIATLSYQQTEFDVDIVHKDQNTGEILSTEKPVTVKKGTRRTFRAKDKGHFLTPEGYEYVPINESVTITVNRDRTVVFNYKASIPDPSRIVEQGGGYNTHGSVEGQALWRLAKNADDVDAPQDIEKDYSWMNVEGGVAITKYHGNQKNINIPETLNNRKVVRIGNEAFRDKDIAFVDIPQDVTFIGSNAFSGNRLTSVTIPDGVTEIGDGAFRNNRIDDINIPVNITYIGNNAFENNMISRIELPNTLTRIGNYAFNNNELTKLVLPESVTSVGNSAFANNDLTELELTTNLENIGQSAFANNNLEKVTIQNNKTVIGNNAFSGNQDNPNDFTIIAHDPSTAKSYADEYNHSFIDLNNDYDYVDVEGGVEITKYNADAVNVNIPNQLGGKNVVSIGERAFAELGLVSVTIPNTVKTIKEGAFLNNELTNVNIPEGVQTIGLSAFENNNLRQLVLPASVVTIEGFSFRNNELESLNIKGSVEVIGNSAFEGNKLEKINFPSGLREIGDRAFADNNIKEIEILHGLITIGKEAFWNNELKSVLTPSTIRRIGDGAFADNLLEEVYVRYRDTEIGDLAFDGNQINAEDLTIIGPSSSSAEKYAEDYGHTFIIGIATINELDAIRNNLNGNYRLINDIDLTYLNNWNPIGTHLEPFTGVFDGNGHVIRNLKITSYHEDPTGFFAYAKGAIKNVGFENVYINAPYAIGVGAIVGSLGINHVNYEDQYISNAYATGVISGALNVGGLVGTANFARLDNVYSNVMFSDTASRYIGGLIGQAYYVTVESSYSSSVMPYTGDQVGGLFGSFENYSEDFWLYWDVEKSKRTFPIGDNRSTTSSLGVTTENMKKQSTFVGFDFENTWYIDEGNDYPKLQIFRKNDLAYAEDQLQKMDNNVFATNDFKYMDLGSKNTFKNFLTSIFTPYRAQASTDDEESKLYALIDFLITGNHFAYRNPKYTLRLDGKTEESNEPITIFTDAEPTKDKDMEYNFEYQYTNHYEIKYKCVDKKGNDCFKWEQDGSLKPVWNGSYSKTFSLADVNGLSERYATSRLGRIENSSVIIYDNPTDKTGKTAGSRAGTTYYIKEKAIEGLDVYYLLSDDSSGAKNIIGWVNEKDLQSFTHFEMDRDKKEFRISGTGTAVSRPWGSTTKQAEVSLNRHKGKKFTVSRTEIVGDNIWYYGKIQGVSGNVWVNRSQTNSNEVITVNAPSDKKISGSAPNGNNLKLKMDHRYGDTFILDKPDDIKLLVSRQEMFKDKERISNEYYEQFNVSPKDTSLTTQLWKEVKEVIEYNSDFDNYFYVSEGDKYYFPYDLDENLRSKYENETEYDYSDYAIPLRVASQDYSEVEFQLEDNFFITKKLGFVFSLPHLETNMTRIDLFAKQQFKDFTNEELDDVVISDPYDASRYYINVDLSGEQEPNVEYDDNLVIGKLGLSDITVHLLQTIKFDQYLFGHFKDEPVFVEQKTSIVRDIEYPNKVTLSSEQMDELRTIEESRKGKIHSFRNIDDHKVLNELKGVVPEF